MAKTFFGTPQALPALSYSSDFQSIDVSGIQAGAEYLLQVNFKSGNKITFRAADGSIEHTIGTIPGSSNIDQTNQVLVELDSNAFEYKLENDGEVVLTAIAYE